MIDKINKENKSGGLFLNILMVLFALGGMYVGSVVPDILLSHIIVFVYLVLLVNK